MRLTTVLLLAVFSLVAAQDSKSLLRKAKKAEKAGDAANAYIYYTQAAALEPNNTTYWAKSQTLRTKALLQAEFMPADLGREDPSDTPDPELAALLGKITLGDLQESERPQPPERVAGKPGRQHLHLQGNYRELWEKVAERFGLEVVFDGDYTDGEPTRLRSDDVDFEEALRITAAATSSFWTPVSETVLLIAQDTVQKRQDLAPNMAVVIPLPEPVSVQEAQELAQSVQQAMEIQKLVVDSTRRMVLMRDRVAKVRPAQALFEQMLHRRPEVFVEVEFIEVSNNLNRRYGFDLQTSLPIVWLSQVKNLSTTIPTGFNFATFGGGATVFGLGLAGAELFASMSESNSRTLMRSSVRAVAGQKATLKVGERFPILTAGFFGPIEGDGEVFRPPPTINFEDLGVVVNVTPHVHGDREVTLEVETEFKVLAGRAINGIPIIANRTFQGVIRLRNDEWAVMAGLADASEVRSVSGLAGLSQIPILGPLFRRNTTDRERSEALLVLKPTLVNLPPMEVATPEIWTGTETKPKTSI